MIHIIISCSPSVKHLQAKPNNISNILEDVKNTQVFQAEKLELVNFSHFCLKN